jgi:hypothetical protein
VLTNRRRVVPKAGRAGGGSEIWGRRPRPPSASSGFPLAFRPPAKRAPNRTRPLREARLAASGDWLLLKRLASEAQLQREGVYIGPNPTSLSGAGRPRQRGVALALPAPLVARRSMPPPPAALSLFFLVSPRLPSLTPILLLAFRGYHSQLTWAVEATSPALRRSKGSTFLRRRKSRRLLLLLFFFRPVCHLSVLYMCKLARVKAELKC